MIIAELPIVLMVLKHRASRLRGASHPLEGGGECGKRKNDGERKKRKRKKERKEKKKKKESKERKRKKKKNKTVAM